MVNQFLEGKAGVVSEIGDNIVVDVQARFPRLLGPRASGVDLSSIMGSSNGTVLGKLLVKFPASSLLFKMDTNRLVGASAMHSLTPYWTAGGASRSAAQARPALSPYAPWRSPPPLPPQARGTTARTKASAAPPPCCTTPQTTSPAPPSTRRACAGCSTCARSPPTSASPPSCACTLSRGSAWCGAPPLCATVAPCSRRAPAAPAQAVLGYTFAFPKAGSRMGAYVTNEGNIMAALEERFSDRGRIVFGADCSPLTHEYRFGLGVQYGPAADTVQFGRSEGARAPDGGLHHWLRASDRSLSHAKSAGRTFPIGWGDALPSPRPRMPFSPVMQQMGYRFY